MLGASIWIGPAISAVFSEVARRRLHGDPPANARDLLFYGGDWLIYALYAPIIFWLAHKWPVARPHLTRRVALHLGFALLFCVAWALLGKILELGLFAIIDPQKLMDKVSTAGDTLLPSAAINVTEWILNTLPFGMVVYVTVSGLAHAIRYFDEARDREVHMARLSEQLTSARFSALQAQLNPHFLFNALNTLAVRARDGDGAGTAVLVEQLSDVLRRTLTRHRSSEVTLAEEMELVRQYLAIEQSRFSDRLRPILEVDDELLPAAVPSFALQHLVENAVRHGIARRTGAERVVVAARRDHDVLELSVTDDGPGIDSKEEPPAGHGIASTRERLDVLYGAGNASLELHRQTEGGTRALLRIPFRKLTVKTDAGDE